MIITTGTRPESDRSGFRLQPLGHDGFKILLDIGNAVAQWLTRKTDRFEPYLVRVRPWVNVNLILS